MEGIEIIPNILYSTYSQGKLIDNVYHLCYTKVNDFVAGRLTFMPFATKRYTATERRLIFIVNSGTVQFSSNGFPFLIANSGRIVNIPANIAFDIKNLLNDKSVIQFRVISA